MDRDAALLLLDSCLFRIRKVQSKRPAMREHATHTGVWLSLTSLTILADLDREGSARMQTLAERIQAELSRTSREVHALAEDGFVELVADERDRRAVIVQLTDLGAAQWRSHHDAVRGILSARLADWPDADIARFAELFDQFLTTLGPAEPAALDDAPATSA
jgi:DNA-binding MarR family transcriptional regulator